MPCLASRGSLWIPATCRSSPASASTAWTAAHRKEKPNQVDVTEALKPGENTLSVIVANLWVNRIIGDQRFPADVEWTSETGSTAAGLGLSHAPDRVKDQTPRPDPERKAFYGWKWPHRKAHRKLLPSGLLGPVRLLERSGESAR